MLIKIFLVVVLITGPAYLADGARLRAGSTCTPPWFVGGSEGSCGCVNDIVLCKRLTKMRPFPPNSNYKQLEIEDSDLVFTDTTFHNLNVSKLIIANNNITFNITNESVFLTDILKKNLKVLSLSNNGLTTLPGAIISKLDALKSLDISGNPIPDTDLTEDVFRSIGDTLEVLNFGDAEIKSWPTSLKHLQMLKKLNVTEASFFLIPQNAFYGFEGTLRQLTIQKTNLVSIPLAVRRLLFLDTLNFDHNKNVGDNGLRVPKISGLLPYLTNMSLQDNSAHTLPESLAVFHKLKNLDVSENDLKFISDQSAENIKSVTSLSMRNSNISRIPGALHTMTSLVNLDMSGNRIHSLERNDLSDLDNLQMLRLDDNPLLYLNKDVFAYLFQLRELHIARTNLTVIPCAVGGIKQQTALIDLIGNEIECNCDLKWIEHWIHDNDMHLTFLGQCATIESSIQYYITNILPICPDFNRNCYAPVLIG